MSKKVLFIFFFLIFGISFANATYVQVTANAFPSYTQFQYNFYFNQTPSIFSMEKPKGSQLESMSGMNKTLSYVTAGDFFIFTNTNPKAKNFSISFRSYSTSQNIEDSNSFSTYMNFNFPVQRLSFRLNLKSDFGKVIQVFPRNYELVSNASYVWELSNLQKDTFFLINFEPKGSPTANSSSFFSKFIIEILISALVIVTLILVFFIRKYNKSHKKNHLEKISEEKETNSLPVSTANLSKEKNIDKTKDAKEEKKLESVEKFEEILDKYLTENEKVIVELVRKNEGIIQNDILNHIPTLTKSNLSKIISKLHSRKFLNRIKVGKINKIYLGSKFEKTEIKNEDDA